METKTFQGASGYKKLSFLPFNRDFTLRDSLVKSMQKQGFISHIYCCYSKAINGAKELYVLDGQNRALAAHYLNIPFYVGILPQEPKTVEELVNLVAIYNNTSIAWRLETYCKAYATIGKPDYVELLQLSKENGQSVNTIGFLLSGGAAYKACADNSPIKKGTFKISAKITTVETLRLAKLLTHKMSGRMLVAFHSVRLTKDNFDFNKFKFEFNRDYKNLRSLRLDDFTEKFILMGT